MNISNLRSLFETHRRDMEHLKHKQTAMFAIGMPLIIMALLLEIMTDQFHVPEHTRLLSMWTMDFIDGALIIGWGLWSMNFMRTIIRFERESTILVLDALDEVEQHVKN